jgi:hypothetical protein
MSEKSYSPERKKKRLTKFQDNWLENEEYKQWLTKKDDFTGYCTYCLKEFTVKYEGIKAVNIHKNSGSHKTKTNSIKMSQTLQSFISKKSVKDIEEVAISEVCLTYHSVTHHISYNSMDCNNKLNKILFHDSKICKEISCGRTKMEAIAKNVLSPLSIDKHLIKLKGKKFSIASDASNKGNVKLFPIVIQYFDTSDGIINFVLDFYEDPNETSDAIYQRIMNILKENNLDVMDISGYCADNASVNYGKYKSVYMKLRQNNENIIKANCNCHVLHNTIKYALIHLPFDIENIVLKIYAHFATSAKRVESLKSCYEFTDNDYESVRRHVPTRWLSLYPAIQRLIEHITPLKEYFIGLGTDECPHIINEFVWAEKTNNITIPEMYLHLSSHLMQIFFSTIKIMEKTTTNATNIYDLMFKLLTQLENRLKYNFFGSKINENINYFDEEVKQQFLINAKNSYERAISYLKNHFDFEKSPFKMFSCLNLDSDLSYEKILIIKKFLNIECNEDILFDEIISFNNYLNQKEVITENIETIDKIRKILLNNKFENLTKIIETVLSIPIGNDYTERVFSHLRRIWTNERSSMSLDLIKAEICIKNNFKMNCFEFNSYVKSNEKLLKSVKSNEKYK